MLLSNSSEKTNPTRIPKEFLDSIPYEVKIYFIRQGASLIWGKKRKKGKKKQKDMIMLLLQIQWKVFVYTNKIIEILHLKKNDVGLFYVN